MYICKDCDLTFDVPMTKSLEEFYGVASEFNSMSNERIELCPLCESNDISLILLDDESKYGE